MGGPQHAARQEAANHSHQATADQVHTTDDSELFQSELSSVDVQTPNHPPPPDLEQAWRTKELIHAPEEQKLVVTLQELVENPGELVRTADGKWPSADPELFEDRSSSSSPEPEPSSLSGLSLFRGMELLLTKGRVLCEGDRPHTEVDKTDSSLGVTDTVQNSDSSVISVQTSDEVASSCKFVASDKPQPVSAFSFLNF